MNVFKWMRQNCVGNLKRYTVEAVLSLLTVELRGNFSAQVKFVKISSMIVS